MLLEDAQSIPGMTLMDAIDLLRPREPGEPPVSEDAVAAKNAESLSQLESLMKGVKRN